MTIAEMHELEDLLIDKANAPYFTPEEKDRFTILATNEYVKNKYAQFETDENVREDLLTLVSDFEVVTATDIIDLEAIDDFLFVLRIECDITNECGTQTGIPVSPNQHDDFSENQRDPFNKADDRYPVYLQNVQGGNRVVQVFSENTPDEIRMIYLKQPVEVSITTPTNSDLPEHTHEEIVNLAVRKMLATIEGFDNYQVQSNEIQKQE